MASLKYHEDERWEVKRLCDMMDAILIDLMVDAARQACITHCFGCEVNHSSQREHQCLMWEEEDYLSCYGVIVLPRLLPALRRAYMEAVAVRKWPDDNKAWEHFEHLGKCMTTTYHYLIDMKNNSDIVVENQRILNYIFYWLTK